MLEEKSKRSVSYNINITPEQKGNFVAELFYFLFQCPEWLLHVLEKLNLLYA